MSSGSTRRKGRESEDAALRYLLTLGYRLLERNFTKLYGEIDLIMEDQEQETLVFLEVKSGNSELFPAYLSAVTEKKCKKIAKVAAVYIENLNREYQAYRMDAVFVERNGEKQIQHLKNIYIL